jgi:LDH2 family malate/lactate/ureidoglycolate dehydrogenase
VSVVLNGVAASVAVVVAGLAMIMGIFASMLSGAAYGTELGDMERGPGPGLDGHFFMAIKVGAFEEPSRFKARVDAAIDQIHRCRLAPGATAAYAPGEVEAIAAERNLREGVPLNALTLADLERTARGLGLDFDLR